MNTKALTALIVIVLVTGATSPSHAEKASPGNTEAPSRIVRYADLDLATPDGVRTLYNRIQAAAWNVCGDIVAPHNGVTAIENGKCRQMLIDVAVKQVNKPALTALHLGKRSEVTARGDQP